MDDMESYPLPKPFPLSMEPMRQPTYSEETIRNNELAEEIAVLAAQLQSADYRLLVLLREFDEKGGWAARTANPPGSYRPQQFSTRERRALRYDPRGDGGHQNHLSSPRHPEHDPLILSVKSGGIFCC